MRVGEYKTTILVGALLMYKIIVFVPESHLEELKTALFKCGAGKNGNYDQCSWQVKGKGQFRGLEGSEPYIGDKFEKMVIDEYKLEMACKTSVVKAAISVIEKVHPYGTPVYEIYKIVKFKH